MKTYFLGKKKAIIPFIIHLLLSIYGSSLQAITHEALPIKEVIIGLKNTHKKALQKHSIYQPGATFLGIPIDKWLYQWGKKHFNLEKINNEIASIKATYDYRISEATNEKEKNRLNAKRDRLIKRKQNIATNGNRLMRMGAKPLYYNPIYVQHNEKIFLNYLHSKGYLDAEVTSKTDLQNKKVQVSYYIKQKSLYKIASISLQIACKSIKNLLVSHSGESFIKVGRPYQYQDFINEQERIINLLSDNGYFEFDEQYVYFKADVSPDDHTIAVTTIVGIPDAIEAYHKTKIGRVVVDLTNQKDHQSSVTYLQTKACQDLDFLIPSDGYPLDDLASKIPLRPGDFYNKSKILETYERLYRIATFESIAILPKIEADQLVIYIHAKPYERLRLQTELGLESINLNLKRLRPTMKLIPTIRRVGGLGILNIEASVALREDLIAATSHHRSQHMAYGLRGKFTIPRFMLWLPKRANLILESFSPSTTIDFGYSFTKNPIYSSQKIDAALNYDWSSQYIAYQLAPIKIVFDYPQTIDPIKIDKLKAQPSSPSFLTSIGYTATIKESNAGLYLYSLDRYRWMVAIGIEHGGLFEHLLASKHMLPKSLQLYRYIKFDIGYRHAFNLTAYTTLACQAKLGMVSGYQSADTIHPDKQYAIGGHGSVRAWDRGVIGPGVYEVEEDNKEQQKGDLLLLGNIELRRKLIGYLEGALFLDIGNTWQLSKEADPKMKFYFHKFYKAFAVGGGFGLRLNFYNTFVLCGDLAFPLHKPSGNREQKLQPAFTLNIGYPF
ncbi:MULTISPECIES: BamA/TamA family outer membrane protein [unclassified Candidatus Cardinium]|uniref:BamA/TamA family outer membrane protein n=1 Tax=unclassified Candidatus Cardinium TaxID=2641185 RepID=UPI001FB2F4EC|nr:MULTISPECIES: BamA/TamA family outer membrane protein [unclassified Candidatus Cardinium]